MLEPTTTHRKEPQERHRSQEGMPGPNASRFLLCPIGVLGLAIAAGLFMVRAAARPNLLLIVADDLGPTLGCYGDKAARTPNIDRLAAEGVRFSHAFCTTASCSPSRSVLLTGLQNHANGQYGLAHATHHFASFDSVKPLPVLLNQAGYRTARIGKFHVQPEALYRFDEVLTGYQGGDRNSVAMAERCASFMAEKTDRPFFLYFCPTDPHRSGDVNTNSPYKPDRFGNGKRYDGVHEIAFDPAQVVPPSFLPDTPECRAELAEYYQSVARFDQGVGRLLDALSQTGHRDDTVVILLSDNGIPFPGAKTTVYEPGLRLPLIVRAPGLSRTGIVNGAMVSWVDISPTLLDYAGAKGPEYPLHGRSFRTILDHPDAQGWDEVYASHTFHEVTMYYPMRAVRTRQFKLILNLASPLPFPFASDLHGSATWQGVLRRGDRFYGRRRVEDFQLRPRWELYDLERDPDETVNLVNSPRSSRVLDELRQKLRAFQEKTKDPWLLKYDRE